MDNEELARLKARALKASPGPWSGDRYDGTVKYELRDANGRTIIRGDNGNSGEGGYGIENEEDEEYFLAASPDVVIALIERIEALTVDAERYKHVRKHSEMYYFAYRNPDMGHAFSQAECKIMDQVVDASMAGDKK